MAFIAFKECSWEDFIKSQLYMCLFRSRKYTPSPLAIFSPIFPLTFPYCSCPIRFPGLRQKLTMCHTIRRLCPHSFASPAHFGSRPLSLPFPLQLPMQSNAPFPLFFLHFFYYGQQSCTKKWCYRFFFFFLDYFLCAYMLGTFDFVVSSTALSAQPLIEFCLGPKTGRGNCDLPAIDSICQLSRSKK